MSNVPPELQAIRALLRDYVRYERAYQPALGLPRAVPYLRLMRPSVAPERETEQDEQVDAWAMGIVEACLDDIAPDHRNALRVAYWNEAGPAVWRSGRLRPGQLEDLCIAAEWALVALVRAKGLLI